MKILNLRNFLFCCARIASPGQFLKSYIFDVKQEIEMVYLKWSFCEDVEIDESIAKIISNECQRSIYKFWVSQGFRKTRQMGKNGKKWYYG